MPPPTWTAPLRLALSANAKDAHVKYVSLATVDANGGPRCRTVVFRGFLKQFWDGQGGGEGDQDEEMERCVTFVTDLRSAKVKQTKACDRAEASWYFTRTREQFRLRGSLRIVGEGDDEKWLRARTRAWKALSDKARSQFAWDTPGMPLRSHPEQQAEDLMQPGGQTPLPTFGLVVLRVERVDQLSLKQNRRWIHRNVDCQDEEESKGALNNNSEDFEAHGSWSSWEVNP